MEQNRLDILAIGVHPDDIELACSGTLLKSIASGKKVGLLDLTRGELGSRGSAEIRDEEAANSAKLMGAVVRENCRMKDGFFQHTEANLLKIIEVIRAWKPDIVLANAIYDRHPDHGRAAKLIADACFLSGLLRIETKRNKIVQEHWRPRVVYHYVQDYHIKPDFVVDISDFMEQKLELILTFKSQFFNPESTEPETPISGKAFLDFLSARAQDFGRPAGIKYAEGFTVGRTPAVNQLFDLR